MLWICLCAGKLQSVPVAVNEADAMDICLEGAGAVVILISRQVVIKQS